MCDILREAKIPFASLAADTDTSLEDAKIIVGKTTYRNLPRIRIQTNDN